MATFGEEIRKVRKSKDMTLEQIANMVDKSPVYISDIEKGKRQPPRKESVVKMCKSLGVDAERFIDLSFYERRSIEIPENTDIKKINKARKILGV